MNVDLKIFSETRNRYVVSALLNGKEIGSAAVIVDIKRVGKPAGLVEDVFVDENYRGQGIGKKLVERLVEICRVLNCYKLTLACDQKNVAFYEKCGWRVHQIGMRIEPSQELQT